MQQYLAGETAEAARAVTRLHLIGALRPASQQPIVGHVHVNVLERHLASVARVGRLDEDAVKVCEYHHKLVTWHGLTVCALPIVLRKKKTTNLIRMLIMAINNNYQLRGQNSVLATMYPTHRYIAHYLPHKTALWLPS